MRQSRIIAFLIAVVLMVGHIDLSFARSSGGGGSRSSSSSSRSYSSAPSRSVSLSNTTSYTRTSPTASVSAASTSSTRSYTTAPTPAAVPTKITSPSGKTMTTTAPVGASSTYGPAPRSARVMSRPSTPPTSFLAKGATQTRATTQARSSYQAFVAKNQKSTSTASRPKQDFSRYRSEASRLRPQDTRDFETQKHRYYGSYYSNPSPTVVYHTSYGGSGFGIWDYMFLDAMLDNHRDDAAAFAYNHQNDPGYQAYLASLQNQAGSNAEIKAKLDDLNTKVATMQGPKDPNYLPQGVSPAIAYSRDFIESQKPALRLCTAAKDGQYYATGTQLVDVLDSVNVEVIETQGTMDNFDRITAGTCDAAIVQRDGFYVYANRKGLSGLLPFERVAALYMEQVHLVCYAEPGSGCSSGAGVHSITDLSARTPVLIGTPGSGSHVFWDNLLTADAGYKDVPTREIGGADAIQEIAKGEASCMVYVAGNDAPLLQRIEQAAENGQKLRFAAVDDDDLDSIHDPGDHSVYVASTIEDPRFPVLGSASTYNVLADLIVSETWVEKNRPAYGGLQSDLVQVLSQK